MRSLFFCWDYEEYKACVSSDQFFEEIQLEEFYPEQLIM